MIGIVLLIGGDSISLQSNRFDIDSILVSIFLLFVTIAVTILVYAGIQKGKYNIEEYNLMHDKESETYKKGQLTGTICGCLMMFATILYLIAGFVFNAWGVPSIAIFPIFGIGCGIAAMIVNTLNKK